MPTPARFPFGVATRVKTHPFGNVPFPDPTQFISIFNDFTRFVAAEWVFTEVTGNSTQATTTGAGGLLLLSHPATTDDSLLQMQPAATFDGAVPPFILALGKKAVYACRFSTTDVTQSDLAFGLGLIDTTTIVADGTYSPDTVGVFLHKADGAATLALDLVAAGPVITSTPALATLVNATFVEVAFAWDGVDRFTGYINGVKQAEQMTLTNRPTVALTPTLVFNTGDNVGTKTMTVDYIYACTER